MRKFSLLVLALLALTVAVAVPAQANNKPGNKCQPIAVSFVVSGTVVSGALTRDAAPAKTHSGTLMVHVTVTNSAAAAVKGLTETYTLTHAHVSFAVGVNRTAPAVGSRVNLKGTITTLAPKCSLTGFTPTIVIKKVEIRRAKTH